MKTSIFIKTWSGDIPWLRYVLQSIKLYGTGIHEVVIAADVSCLPAVRAIITDETVCLVDDWDNGYIQQQWIKLNADYYTNYVEQVLYVDSDCIFHTPFSPESFMIDGKPYLMKTRYGTVGDGEVWKVITESFVEFTVNFEYMRRLPCLYRTDTLQHFRNEYPYLYEYLKGLDHRNFSEFNALGAFVDKYEAYRYSIIDTADCIPKAVAKQFWSWGGITSEIQTEINQYLKVGELNVV